MKLIALAACSALVVAGFSSNAGTDAFNFTFESNSTIIASGQITTSGPFVMGQAAVTNITGTYDGFPITGLLPNNTAGFSTNDVLYNADPFVDILGIIFSSSNDNTVANIFPSTNSGHVRKQ